MNLTFVTSELLAIFCLHVPFLMKQIRNTSPSEQPTHEPQHVMKITIETPNIQITTKSINTQKNQSW